MKRKLIKQIFAEWRSNIWLFLEMLIVSLVLWYINDFLYAVYSVRAEPDGFDTENVYKMHYTVDWSKVEWPESDSEYMRLRDSINTDQMRKLMERLKAEPGVEAVSANFGITPHNYNFQGDALIDVEDSTLVLGGMNWNMVRNSWVFGDICSVLGIKGINGETSRQLDDMLAQGKSVITSNVRYNKEGLPKEEQIDSRKVVGKRFYVGNGHNAIVTIGAVVAPIKRATYESAADMITILIPGREMFGDYLGGEVLVRVKDSYPGDFAQEMRSRLATDYSFKYLYLTDVESMSEIKTFNNRQVDQQQRMYIAMCIFLMVNIFLGLLGSFWFRTQQRGAEIAIRMVHGATPMRVLMRVVSEAMLLLVATLPFTIGVVWLMVTKEGLFTSSQVYDDMLLPTVAAGLLTYAEMGVMVLLGTLFPALKSMHTKPSVVLQEE